MAKEFRNVKMAVAVAENAAKLDITVDVSEFVQGTDLPISSTGVTYNVASTFGGHKLEGSLEGLYIDLKVYTKKEYWERKQQHAKQVAMAQAALKEFENNKGAQQALSNLGFDPAQLAQAIALMQTMNAQNAASK